MNLIEKTEKYFNLFALKNLKGLNELYADNVHLIDWTGEWIGKDAVLKMNEQLFQNHLKLDYHRIGDAGSTTYGQITVRVNDERIKVIDVIDWNAEGKIVKIEAYKG